MTKRTLRGLAALGLGLALGAPARADQGTATLESKGDGVVSMNARTYRVSDSTVLEGKDGQRVSFAELPTLAEGASDDAAAVWFEADDDPKSPLLYRLKLTGATPD